MFFRLFGLCCLLAVAALPVLAAADEAPPWLQQAAAIKVPWYDKDVPAVVLQKEQRATVGQDGKVTKITTVAIRVLIREGREYAYAREFYDSGADKVREMHAWLIRPSGPAKRYDSDDIVDAVEDTNDIYNESRYKIIDATNDADAGSVFGFQIITEERSIFSQDVFNFQYARLPGIASRYILTLPAGWHAKGVAFNHENLEPSSAVRPTPGSCRISLPSHGKPAAPA